MATGSWQSIADLAHRLDPFQKIDYVAEMMSQANELWDHVPWLEANEVGGHQFTFRTSIPPGAWRAVNAGVPYGKSTTAQARIGIASLEGYSQIDRWLAESSGDVDRYRESEDVAFMEGMGQTMTGTYFYGNSVSNPAQFMGLSPFYNTVSAATALNAANVIDGLGTGSSNASLWLLGLGERTIFNVYPRGSRAGLTMENKGDTVPGFDNLGNRFEAYTSYFRQQAGLVPMDWRYGVRLCNIDVTNAGLAGPNAADLFALMAQMVLMLPAAGRSQSGIVRTDAPNEPAPGIRTCFFANRTIRHWMDVQRMRDRQVLLSIDDYAGRPTAGYREGMPIYVCDQLLNTETRVV